MKIRYRYWACQLGGWGLFTYLWNNIRAGEGFAFRTDAFTDKDFYSAFAIGIFATHLLSSTCAGNSSSVTASARYS